MSGYQDRLNVLQDPKFSCIFQVELDRFTDIIQSFLRRIAATGNFEFLTPGNIRPFFFPD
ncbi:MAG: hypothetical protein XE10_0799 [Methanoculleus marisnigri]|jgi:hypothetical protein|uniref:Uncharacterized protein n=1 Tax=Methanoculleus marisnigri TaxID=2198 RepID=A0A101GRC1_9EURY|nr:MAG: hypothetical protein XD82_0542 [Methanoculleus marisnigri]KUL02154.1 MAG: hypothetical protein XE10_0799 [Methanoculleus marisnigri]